MKDIEICIVRKKRIIKYLCRFILDMSVMHISIYKLHKQVLEALIKKIGSGIRSASY